MPSPPSKMIALIPARGGSKGIPQKNIIPLAGKPLIFYTIDAAQKAAIFNDIVVSSDDMGILTIAAEFGASCFVRSAQLAQDTTSSNAVIDDFILRYALSDEDIVMLLQPTSPLRTSSDICAALNMFNANNDCAALISVSAIPSKYLYAFTGADPYLTPLAPAYIKISRRQDLPNLYLPNGAIYLFKVAEFRRHNAIPLENIIALVMPESDSVDIDTMDDLKKAEYELLRSRKGSH